MNILWIEVSIVNWKWPFFQESDIEADLYETLKMRQ